MKLKVTAEGKGRGSLGSGKPILDSMLYVLCSMLFAISPLLFVSQSYCDTASLMSDDILTSDVQARPAIVSAVRPIYLPKTTKLEIVSDKPLKMKQVKLSQGGVLKIEIFSATTSLPDSISIDKGILRGVACETGKDELRLYVSLTEPVIYDVESTEQGLTIVFQNPVLEQLVSLNINEESLSTVLLMLFMEYGANIVAGSDVSGTVTAHLVDVPLKNALDEILEAEGYGYIEDGGLIRVMSADDIQAVASADEIISPIISVTPVETRSELFELAHASVSDIQPTLQKLIGSDGTILADQRTNSVIILAKPQDIEKAREIIDKLDKEISEDRAAAIREISPADEKAKLGTPAVTQIVKRVFKLNYLSPEKAGAILQPLLSPQGTVEIVEEKEETDSSQRSSGGGAGGGMAGGAAGSAGSGMQLGRPVGKGGYIVVSDIPEVMEKIEEQIPEIDIPIAQVEIEAYIVEGTLSDDAELGIDWVAVSGDDEMELSFNGEYGGILTKGIMTAEKFMGILNVLANSSELNVLSNPRITTLEDQPAIFHSGDKVPYSRIFIQDGIEQIDTVFEDVGIVLTATPQVKEGDLVSLLISTSVSSEGGFTPSGQPRISTRTTQSQVLVKSGDTAVIAGLISEKSSIAVSKVPLIGDIPLIGRAFSTERELKQKSEITIFITPRIIPESR